MHVLCLQGWSPPAPAALARVGVITLCRPHRRHSLLRLQVHAFAMDVRDPEAVKAALDKVVAAAGVPDIVVNNAAGASS